MNFDDPVIFIAGNIPANAEIAYTLKHQDNVNNMNIQYNSSKVRYFLSYVCSTAAQYVLYSMYNQWTNISHLGDDFCLGVTFATVQDLL